MQSYAFRIGLKVCIQTMQINMQQQQQQQKQQKIDTHKYNTYRYT